MRHFCAGVAEWGMRKATPIGLALRHEKPGAFIATKPGAYIATRNRAAGICENCGP